MPELRRIVDDIRSILYSDVDPDPDRLEVLVDEYVAACVEVNEQLHKCEDLLHRGLRDEAIQRAEAANLLESVATLDFPEQEQWATYVSICGLPLPPDLAIDQAAELNEAYSAQQPLEPLLRLMRLSNLAKSPLTKRIAIIRRIEQKDRGNPIWSASIKEFERERQRQLKEDVVQAIKEKNIKSLASLEQELRSPDWATKPSKSLIKQAGDGHTKLRQDRARKEMNRLQQELNDAYADFDTARARRARARWNALSAIVDFDASDSQLLDLVGPALAWLDQLDASEASQQQYDANLARLRLALDDWIHNQSEYESIRSLEETLRASEAGIPEVDQVRLEERYLQFKKMKDREHFWKVSGIVAAVLMLAVLTGGGVLWYLRAADLEQTVASLESLMESENLEGATAFLGTLETEDPGAYGDSRIQKIRQDLDSAIQNEQARQQNFESKLQEARRVGLNNPTWDSFAAAREILKTAGEIAKRESEVLAFNELGGQIREAERQMLKQEQDKFLAQAEKLQSEYEGLPDDDMRGLEQMHEHYGQLLAWEHVPEEIKRTPGELQKRIEGQIDGLRRMEGQTLLFDRITEAVGRRRAYETQLTAAKSDRSLSGNRQAQDIATVLTTDPRIWVGLEAWNDFIADFEDINLTEINPEQAATLISRAGKLITDHPGFPGEAAAKELQVMLTPVTKRVTAGGQRTDSGVGIALTNVTIQRVYYLRTKDDAWYYSPDEPSEVAGGQYRRVQYYKNLNLDQSGIQIRVSDIANERSGTSFQWLSPQSEFSRDALRMHRSLTLTNWDKGYLELLTRLFNDSQMDPVFKYQLLQAIIAPALQGSWPLQQGFQQQHDMLVAGTVNTQENYFAPGTEESRKVRGDAQGVLGQFPSTTASIERVNSAMQTMQEFRVGERYTWLGWLHLDRSSNWVCEVPEQLKPDETLSGELYIIYASSTSSPPEIKLAGTLKMGQIQLKEPAGGFVAGRPIFFVASSDK